MELIAYTKAEQPQSHQIELGGFQDRLRPKCWKLSQLNIELINSEVSMSKRPQTLCFKTPSLQTSVQAPLLWTFEKQLQMSGNGTIAVARQIQKELKCIVKD